MKKIIWVANLVVCLGFTYSAVAGNKSGNGDYCIQDGAKCERVNFAGDVVHPMGTKLKELIQAVELPNALKREMLDDLDKTLVIYSKEKIKVKDLMSRYYMQVVSRVTEHTKNSDGTSSETVRVIEEWVNASKAEDYGIFVSNNIGYDAGDIENLFVRAVSEVGSPSRVIYFTEFVNDQSMTDDERMKLVLHEQAHRLNFLKKLAKDERFAEAWASIMFRYLTGELDKNRMDKFLVASKLDYGSKIKFENETILESNPNLRKAYITTQFSKDLFLNEGLRMIEKEEFYSPDTVLYYQVNKGSFPGIEFLNQDAQLLSFSANSSNINEAKDYIESLLFSGIPTKIEAIYEINSELQAHNILNTKTIKSLNIVDTNIESIKSMLQQEFPVDSLSNENIIVYDPLVISSSAEFLRIYGDLHNAIREFKSYISDQKKDPISKLIIERFERMGESFLIYPTSGVTEFDFDSTYNKQLRKYRNAYILRFSSKSSPEDIFKSFKKYIDLKISKEYSEEFQLGLRRMEESLSQDLGRKNVHFRLSMDSFEEMKWIRELFEDPKVASKVQCLSKYLPADQLRFSVYDITYDSKISFNRYEKYELFNISRSKLFVYNITFYLPANGFKNERQKLVDFIVNEALGNVFLNMKKSSGLYKYYAEANWNNKEQNYLWNTENLNFFNNNSMDGLTIENKNFLNAVRMCSK